jgi:hypothetical protein
MHGLVSPELRWTRLSSPTGLCRLLMLLMKFSVLVLILVFVMWLPGLFVQAR